MMIMCREATKLMSLKLDRPLTRREQLQLRMHTFMCSACKRCEAQFELLHRLGDELPETEDANDSPPPSSRS